MHCDLSDEQVEEIRMLTSLPVEEIQRIRSKYRAVVQHENMSKAEFYALPGLFFACWAASMQTDANCK
ncbi:hypothetical protein FI667_g4231, partial [Globisporangium splendens]